MKKKSPPPETLQRLSALEDMLRASGSVLLAYSGGVDSTFLLAAAVKVLNDRCHAVTVETLFHEPDEIEDAVRRAADLGARHEVVKMDLEECGGEALANPPDRCYHCKKLVFRTLRDRAEKESAALVIEASHVDDAFERRPGVRALEELGIRSPLLESGLGKDEIRELSEHLGIDGGRRPSRPCLATRIPYGTPVTVEALQRVARAEKVLRDEGFTAPRVRDYGTLARIELHPDEMDRMGEEWLRCGIEKKVREAGYTYVTLDLGGYRSGSMDEVL